MRILLLVLLILPLEAFAQGAFMFGAKVTRAETTADSDTSVTAFTSPSPVRGARRAIEEVLEQPAVTAEDAKTEADFCANGCPVPTPRPNIEALLAAAKAEETDRSPAGTGDPCLRNAILESAKSVVRSRYGNRSYSGGMCAQGVRHILNHSGMLYSEGMGDAVSWHLAGTLKAKGFKNIIGQGYTAATAPPGAILIFRGPKTNMSSPTGGLPRRSRRRGLSAGNWVGHVTVKGEKPGRYYTDGRTEAPAIARRTLVAIYVPVKCVSCRKGKAAAKCGS